MNIGQAAQASGVTAKMIRYYESIGLIPPSPRSDAGYRRYGEQELHLLRFIRQSRRLGFGIDQIRQLLALWQDRGRSSAQVKALAQAHVDELNQRIGELVAMRDTLSHLAMTCHGDDRPDCPILEGIAAADLAGAVAGVASGASCHSHDAESDAHAGAGSATSGVTTSVSSPSTGNGNAPAGPGHDADTHVRHAPLE